MRFQLLSILLFTLTNLWSQNDFIVIQAIDIEGNKQTKSSIVLRELDFGIGDTLSLHNLENRFDFNEKRLGGLDLFAAVDLELKSVDPDQQATIAVQIKENLMWIVYPNVDFADNDLNVWAQRYNYSLKRISIPITFTHLSLTGNQDKLKARVQFGFTRKLEFGYVSPFLDKKQTWRLSSEFLLSDDKEARFLTIGDRDSFLRNEDQRLFNRVRLGTGAIFRPDLFDTHELQLRYLNFSIQPEVAEANPNFFLDGKRRQQFFAIRYQFTSDRRNYNLYPTKGYFLRLSAEKEGLGIWNDRNAFILSGLAMKYFSILPKWSAVTSLEGETNLVRTQSAYYNLPAAGSQPNLIRGHELRQIRGLDFVIGTATLRYHLLDLNINLGKLMPIQKLKQGSVQFYPKVYSDLGYVNAPFYESNNPLTNATLWGRGIGVDAVIYNLSVASIEWSFAELDDKVTSGLFLHIDLVF